MRRWPVALWLAAAHSSCSGYRYTLSDRRLFHSMKLQFDNRNLRQLPVEHGRDPRLSRPIRDAIFASVSPDPVVNPRMVCGASAALDLLSPRLKESPDSALAAVFSGNQLFEGSETAAHCYCGHQFGNFAGQLGDGTVVYLGEVINENGDRWEVQLKGAGKTPFSRQSDGRKVLRSSIREFLASEAVHALGIPTTRAVACVTSDSRVVRDPLYDGHSIQEQCTVVTRIAPNFFRFGSFEIFAKDGPSEGNESLKAALLDHVMSYFPAIAKEGSSAQRKYSDWFTEVVRRTAVLVAKWQCAGFVHGVLNTDNMSVMGLTIDYGPYAFMEFFDADFTPNGSDSSARYRYSQQPYICKWNLLKLATAIAPLVPSEESAAIIERDFDRIFAEEYRSAMKAKLGIPSDAPVAEEEIDGLIYSLFQTLDRTKADFTDTFRALTSFAESTAIPQCQIPLAREQLVLNLTKSCASPAAVVAMMKRKLQITHLSYHPRQIQQLEQLIAEDPSRASEMFNVPLEDVQELIDDEKRKLNILTTAKSAQEIYESMPAEDKAQEDSLHWQAWVEDYCGLLDRMALRPDVRAMQANNPAFVLRNWLMQEAIEAATAPQDDYSLVRLLLDMSQDPFNAKYCRLQQPSLSSEPWRRFCGLPPAASYGLICTCSS